MKSPIMLVCAMVAAMGLTAMAEEKAAGAAGDKAQVQAGKKHGEMTEAQREEMINKHLEQIKAKDEALYKELIALKEKDPEAFKAKMKELRAKEHAAQGQGAKHGKKVETKQEVKK